MTVNITDASSVDTDITATIQESSSPTAATVPTTTKHKRTKKTKKNQLTGTMMNMDVSKVLGAVVFY